MKRVFLVGCPRSGTTLLQATLGSHSCVASFPESHFFRVLLANRNRWRKFFGIGNPRIALQIQRFFSEIESSASFGCPTRFPRVRRCTDAFVSSLDKIAESRGKLLWIEKTPNHVFFTTEIEYLIPNTYFIHLVRDGREVVASLFEVTRKHTNVWHAPWSIDRCISHWESSIRATISRCTTAENQLLVRYEDLVTDPSDELIRISHFLGIIFEPEMLSRPPERTRGIISPGESWKSNVYDNSPPSAFSKFKKFFTPTEQEAISSRVSYLNDQIIHLRHSYKATGIGGANNCTV